MKVVAASVLRRSSPEGWARRGWFIPDFLPVKRVAQHAMLAAIIALAETAGAETISPRRLLEVADLQNPVVSPDGVRVAFRLEQASVERNTYDTVWYVQGMDAAVPPRRVADGGVTLRDSAGISVPAIAVWSPDGRWIYYRALMDGKIDIWRAAADGSGAEPITRDPADVREFSLSADGEALIYSVGATREEVIAAEQAEYDQGIRIDESVPIGQPLFRSGNIEGRLATQRYGAVWFDRAPLLANVPDRWKTIDLVTRERRDLLSSERPSQPPRPSDVLADASALALDPGSDRVALLLRVGDADGLLQRPDVELVMLPSIRARKPVKCLSDLCINAAITNIQWRPHSDEVVFTVTDPHEGGAQSIYRWNVETGAVHPVTQAKGLINGGRDQSSACGVSAAALACVAAEADGPPRLERIDLDRGERRLLFDPNAALAMDIAATAPARLLCWTDANGEVITGQFFAARPAGGVAPPLFITYYRCAGFLRGGTGEEWPLASLAELGISALCINAAPYRLDAVERYNLGLSAVRSAIDLLATEERIDRSKVGMGGLSFGTETALWVAIESDLLAAVSISSPVRSPNHYLFSSLKGDTFFSPFKELWQLGAPDETPERWQVLSPAYNVEKIQEPVLMQMPEQEYIIALEYAIPLIRDRRADLYVFPHEPHQKFQPRHKLAAYQRNLDWFRFWLQGYEDPDPAKRKQYAHWRDMKDPKTMTP